MESIIQQFDEIILKPMHLSLSNLEKNLECEEYFGYNFNVNQFTIKFRKAKITPKKMGQFVTLWKRNHDNQTQPFSIHDSFDYYIIATEDESQLGFYIFSKTILMEKQILSTQYKEGKRGFRVYPNWTKPENKQALKTQNWQQYYFIEVVNNQIDQSKLHTIFK